MLGWPPGSFRRATLRDLHDALAGWREKNGQSPALTRRELRELFEAYPEPKGQQANGA